MKKNTFLTRIFVLIAIFALALAGCNDDTTKGDEGTSKPTDPANPNEPPDTIKEVIGYGYNITSRYAYSPDIKSAILDTDKLLDAKLIKKDSNLRYGEFETITGKNINEYMRSITAKISYSDKANLSKVVSFSNEVGINFDNERITRSEYAFVTSTSRIVTGAYNIINRNGLSAYFTTDFTNDLESMRPEELIDKYGTHVMLGAVLGAKADYHLSVKKKTENNITNLEAYAKARAEAKYIVGNTGTGYSADVDTKFTQYFFTGETLEKTRVFGGKVQYGKFINSKQDYDQWIESIEGNDIWIDYYPNSLIPISDLVTNKILSDALAQAIEDYCKGKETDIPPIEVGNTSFSSTDSSNFAIKGGGQRDWLITTSFSIDGLRSNGYTKFVLILNFDTKNELLINVGSRLYASFWKGLAPNTTKQYIEKYWTPAIKRWEAKELIQEIDIDDFENKLTIHFSTSSNASFTVGTRTITIEARK